MEIQTFFKKAIVIATTLILVFFILFPFFTLNMGAFGSVSKTGLGLLFSIFDHFSLLNLLLIVVPIACGNILYQTWIGKDQFVMISKIIIVGVLGYMFLHIAFFAEKSSIKFVGIGLWLSLLVSIALFFETKIDEMLFPKKNDGDNSPMK